ncbi:MAG: beta strand repeat-containing protein [Bacteroidales bacterium]
MKSKNYFLTLIILLSFFTWTAKADVTKTVGTIGADFATLKAAFIDINTTNPGSYSGVVSLQIIDNTTETVPASLSASGNWTTLNIYPTVTGKTIGGNIDGSLIFLSGVNQLVIDGRLHNASGDVTGSTNDLTITNTFVSATANTIRFNGGSSNNTVKYCTIKGSSASDSNATIFFGAGGNSNNIISNNIITNADNANRPQVSIFSFGGTLNNDNNTISNNEFANWMSATLYSRAIRVYNLNTNWTISGNSFYESASFAPIENVACVAIQVGGSPCTGHTVSGNFVGGSGAQCTGIWTKTAEADNAFTAIALQVGVSPASTVSNNTIKNYNWSSLSFANWIGISISGAVNVTGNTIGATTGTGSIIMSNAASGASSYGMLISSYTTGLAYINNNTIGSMTTNGNYTTLYGIFSEGSAPVTITNNTIGSTSTPNSLYADCITASGQIMYVMRVRTTAANIISGNAIVNASNGSGAGNGSLFGILVSGGTNTVNGNFISKLTAPNSGSTGGYVKVYGISIEGSAASVSSNFYNNIISLGEVGIPVMYTGIQELNAGATPTTNIFFNTVYIGGSQVAAYVQSYGIKSANTSAFVKNIQNNILVSTRSTTGIVWGAHYALFATTGRVTAGASFTCDYNNYFVSGTNSKLGSYAATDIIALPIVTGKIGNDANSKNVNPLFLNAGGASAYDYQPNVTVSLPGTPIAAITTDYTPNTSRGGTPKMGAFESGFYTNLNPIEPTTNTRIISNAVGIAVPLTGESNIELYTINGLLIEKTRANGMYTRNLSNGMYIISIDGKVSKFIK